ncbi:MAG: hypothetical protein QOE64_791, partial [Frankiales bacterium]|nr:hypothetical protein [Frankiales bacterium]
MSDTLIELLREEAERRSADMFSAPSPADVRRAAGRRRRATVAAGASMVLLIGAGVAVASVSERASRPAAEPTPPAASDPEAAAKQKAKSLLDAVTLPSGAAEVPVAPTRRLQHRSMTFGQPWDRVVRAERFWTVPGDIDAITDYFRSSVQHGVASEGGGDVREPGVASSDIFFGDLLITVARVDGTTVGIRADAQIPWTPVRPPSERVPDGLSSVEIRYYVGSVEVPLALRSVSGAEAQHLAGLVNALPIVVMQGGAFRGSLPCIGDILQTRLTFVTDTMTFIITWPGQCGGSVVTIDGRPQ